MKAKYLMAVIISTLVIFASCTKDAGVGGSATISGKVTYSQGDAIGAVVYIIYGSKEKTDTYSNSTVVASDGTYKFDGLQKGDYYLESNFTDEYKDLFQSTGYAVTIGGSDSDVEVNIKVE